MLAHSTCFGLGLNELIMEECKVREVDFREGDFSDSNGFAINVLENQVEGAKFSQYEALSLLQ